MQKTSRSFVGRTIPEAFLRTYYLEMACRAQVDALAGGRELIYPTMESREAVRRAMAPDPGNRLGPLNGAREWPAMLRMPLGVVRILIADMAVEGLVRVHQLDHAQGGPDLNLLERVLSGLRKL